MNENMVYEVVVVLVGPYGKEHLSPGGSKVLSIGLFSNSVDANKQALAVAKAAEQMQAKGHAASEAGEAMLRIQRVYVQGRRVSPAFDLKAPWRDEPVYDKELAGFQVQPLPPLW